MGKLIERCMNVFCRLLAWKCGEKVTSYSVDKLVPSSMNGEGRKRQICITINLK